jgi:hypothetical protein
MEGLVPGVPMVGISRLLKAILDNLTHWLPVGRNWLPPYDDACQGQFGSTSPHGGKIRRTSPCLMIKGITERLGKRRGLATKQLGQIVPVGLKVAGTTTG